MAEHDTGRDERSQRERMLAGDLYIADDERLARDSLRAMRLMEDFNASPADRPDQRRRILEQLLGSIGDGAEIRPPLYCDYGYQTHVGARSFISFGLVVLDVARIDIGQDVQIGPNVQLLTASHPVEPESRRAKRERGQPISSADNVWLGGGVIVCPGVTIGENTVVGAGGWLSGTCRTTSWRSAIPALVTRPV